MSKSANAISISKIEDLSKLKEILWLVKTKQHL
jgi:hypothetical protein